MGERELINEILLELSKRDTRLFRNHVGTGYFGRHMGRDQNGLTYIQNARVAKTGLCKGASDLIGWTSVRIDKDMVGLPVAIFTAIEVKTPDVNTTPEQQVFLGNVHNAGGIARVARSVEDAIKAIREHGYY